MVFTSRTIRMTRIMGGKGHKIAAGNDMKENVTISFDYQTLRKAKIIAAKRGTSIGGLLANQIEVLVAEDEAYERAECQALALLDQGFHMGGMIRDSRDELHES